MHNDEQQTPEVPAGAVVLTASELQARRRPRPGERRMQILHALSAMLEAPGGERITTASLANRLNVSEAALYRHFASKAQMFEGLIDFIEESVFALITQVTDRPIPGNEKAALIVAVLIQFAEKNPGMTRVMVGDALVYENDRLQIRMNQFFDKVEGQLRIALRPEESQEPLSPGAVESHAIASMFTAFVVGRIQRFARSGFKRSPSEHLDVITRLVL